MPTDPIFWNKLARTYAAKPVEDPEAFEKKIALTKELMKPEDCVLDVGCGTGSLALRLAGSGRKIHGLDYSSDMLDIAEGKTREAGVDNVHFHRGAFEDTVSLFSESHFDGLCAYSLLHLLDDVPKGLGTIFSLLKPGGFFVSSTVCLGESWVPYRPILALMRWLRLAPMVKILSESELSVELVNAGFVEIQHPDVGASESIAFLIAKKPL